MIDENRLIEEVEDMMSPYLFADNVREYALKDVIEVIESQPKVNEWFPFTFDEEGMLACKCPEVDEEILVSDGISVWTDTWIEYEGYGLDSNNELEGLAWQPLPTPYKGVNVDVE